MIIRFKKGREGDHLTCERSDGSSTWARLKAGRVGHDLAHWVVETRFDVRAAFYGMIARGVQIPELSQPGAAQALGIEPEAVRTEQLVAELERGQGGDLQAAYDDLLRRWADVEVGASLELEFPDA